MVKRQAKSNRKKQVSERFLTRIYRVEDTAK